MPASNKYPQSPQYGWLFAKLSAERVNFYMAQYHNWNWYPSKLKHRRKGHGCVESRGGKGKGSFQQ